jgi:polyisoprenoid-binding protein YceI
MKTSKSAIPVKVLFKVVFLFLTILIVNANVRAADYKVDKAVSKVKWEGKKVTGRHNGTISFESGQLTVSKGMVKGGSFVIDMKTIIDEDLTDPEWNKKLIGHLSSDDFFSIAKFPQASMVVNKVTSVSGDDFHFSADLTIKGIKKPVEFNAKVKVNGDKLSAQGIITVNRTLYDIKYGSGSFFEGLGDKMISDDFTLEFDVVATKQK